jgi:hypothetical protein
LAINQLSAAIRRLVEEVPSSSGCRYTCSARDAVNGVDITTRLKNPKGIWLRSPHNPEG